MIYISPHWWWFNPHSTMIRRQTSSHSRKGNVHHLSPHHHFNHRIQQVKLSPPFQPSDSTWRPWSTRTCPSPCGTWEARTRFALCGATTTRAPTDWSMSLTAMTVIALRMPGRNSLRCWMRTRCVMQCCWFLPTSRLGPLYYVYFCFVLFYSCFLFFLDGVPLHVCKN